MTRRPTLLFTDKAMLGHAPGSAHPETPRRLEQIQEVLEDSPVEGTLLQQARPATPEELLLVHSAAHVERLNALEGQHAQLDPDTHVSPDSHRAALLAAGASVQAVEAVFGDDAQNAFALVRPPGHHATPSQAMGFCLFNNAAIAAERALQLGADRVAVLDWDVHHGNGTQDAFWTREDVLYLSTHQYPYYPGSGAAWEVGEGAGRGYTVNVPLPSGLRDADYGAAFHDVLLPVLESYAPDVLIISAGFDPHEADPIGGMRVTERGFAAMTARVSELADRVSGGRLVLLLEGGYHLGGLSRSVRACAEVLAGRRDEFPGGVSPDGADAIAAAREVLRTHWPVLE